MMSDVGPLLVAVVRKLASFAIALAVSAPLFAQTDMHQLAADLQRALGGNAVHVEGGASVARGMSAEALVEAMNRERAAAGLGPLRLNATLSAAAGDRIHDMFSKHYFDHISPDGVDPFVWVERRGYDYREIGENLAVGYPTASGVVDGWMHSTGHRENVLGRDFDEIGIAIADGSPRRPYGRPTVVALYGKR
jgi:uncharacterized protein YkwD